MKQSKTPIASARYIWLKVLLMTMGFFGVIKLMIWLNEPSEPSAFFWGGPEPIKARVVISPALPPPARTVSN